MECEVRHPNGVRSTTSQWSAKHGIPMECEARHPHEAKRHPYPFTCISIPQNSYGTSPNEGIIKPAVVRCFFILYLSQRKRSRRLILVGY